MTVPLTLLAIFLVSFTIAFLIPRILTFINAYDWDGINDYPPIKDNKVNDPLKNDQEEH